MTIRNTIIGIVLALGVIASGAGLWMVNEGDDMNEAARLLVVGVAFLASCLVYLMAKDDPDARGAMFGRRRPSAR